MMRYGSEEWGKIVFKNDQALKWSQDHHVRGGRIILFIFLVPFIAIMIFEFLIFASAGVYPPLLLFLLIPLLIPIGQMFTNIIYRSVDQLPVIYEHGILYSSVVGFNIIRIFMPYPELRYILRKKQWVMLYPKWRRGKYAFRIEELGEQGYEILNNLFHGTYSVGGSPKLKVYTEGGPVISHDSSD